MKRQYIQVGGKWKELELPEEYPRREPISLPLTGALTAFTNPIVEYLSALPPRRELFMFGRSRGYQIVNHCTGGEFPHYLREMGLKMWLRLFGKDLSMLQDFSGHKKVENLMHYLQEIKSEEVTSRILSVKFEDFEPKAS